MAKKGRRRKTKAPKTVFQWDAADDEDGNVAHIARHGVTTNEAEAVVRNGGNFARSDSSSYPITFGRSGTGKFLTVVWFAIGDDPRVIRVVTSYEVDPPDRRR